MKLTTRNKKIRKKQIRKKNQFHTFMITIFLIIGLSSGILVATKKEKLFTKLDPEFLRTQTYEIVDSENGKAVFSDGNKIGVCFDAFFKKDVYGDGNLEQIRGTCNEIGSLTDLYFELSVEENWSIKEAEIVIKSGNSENFNLKTNIIKNGVFSENYISNDTKLIKISQVNSGIQHEGSLGYICSGDYSSSAKKTSAIGNDPSKYSRNNKIIFRGIALDNENQEKPFNKEIDITVDWYGKVDCGIDSANLSYSDLENLRQEDGLHLTFPIKTTETLDELIMQESHIKRNDTNFKWI